MGTAKSTGVSAGQGLSVTGARCAPAEEELLKTVEAIAARHRGKPGALLAVLEECQRVDPHHYLSENTLCLIGQAMGEPLSRIYSVATFYSYYNLTPQGDHVIVVCRGTACHTRGSLGLLQEALSILGAKDYREDEEASFTTEDKRFTVRTVACFGQCALAPVVAIDGVIYSRMTSSALKNAIEASARGGKK